LPKTSTGKIQKFELRKQAGSAAAIDVWFHQMERARLKPS
jgi:hypothetical protein